MSTKTHVNNHYGELGVAPLPVEPYVSETRFREEKEKIFKKSWLSVAHISDLPKPGDYVTRDIAVLDTSILIVRGKDGGLKAFHNVCRHRGHRVALEKKGNSAGAFTCLFHAWSYGLDGSLRGVPDEKSFPKLEKCTLGLKPVHIDQWKGFIFINVDPNPAQTLRESMGELHDQFENYDCEQWAPIATMKAELNCNWKLVIDAFMESYHVVSLHRNSAPKVFSSKDNPYSHLNGVRLFKKHRGISIYGNPVQDATPAASINARYAPSAVYVTASKKSDEVLPVGVNPDRRADWAFDEYLIHPNFGFYTSYGWALGVRYWPVSAVKSVYEVTLYASEPTKPSQRIAMEQTVAHLFDVVLEDLSTVERTQDVLASGAIDAFQLSDMEIAIRHGARVIEDELSA